jgi:hypothetical protein
MELMARTADEEDWLITDRVEWVVSIQHGNATMGETDRPLRQREAMVAWMVAMALGDGRRRRQSREVARRPRHGNHFEGVASRANDVN